MWPRIRTNLRFEKFVLINNAGVGYANVRFLPTYAYDIDPALGSTSMPMFAELGAIYRYYRAISSRISVSYSNVETFSLQCCICPVNVDPGANTANYQNYFSSRLSKTQMISPKGGMDRCDLTQEVSTSEFGGVRWTQQLDSYCGTTNGSLAPNANWYWFVGVQPSVAALVSGVVIAATVDIELEFFELLSPSA